MCLLLSTSYRFIDSAYIIWRTNGSHSAPSVIQSASIVVHPTLLDCSEITSEQFAPRSEIRMYSVRVRGFRSEPNVAFCRRAGCSSGETEKPVIFATRWRHEETAVCASKPYRTMNCLFVNDIHGSVGDHAFTRKVVKPSLTASISVWCRWHTLHCSPANTCTDSDYPRQW